MTIAMRSAKIVIPISYEKSNGKKAMIPVGPCLVEQIDEEQIDIVWGNSGQSSTIFNSEEIASATTDGSLVFLD
jgi:hypothetical protein